MIIVSDGDFNPEGISVVRRLPNPNLKGLEKKYENASPRYIQGFSQSVALDLKIIANKISHRQLMSQEYDITGKERSRKYYLQAIEEFINNCDQSGAYIWFIGHSEEGTGNWCFKDGTISFRDIYDIYKGNQQKKLLAIISDCCYSGNFIHQCAEVLDDKNIPPCGHKTRDKSLLIRIYSSSEKSQLAQELCYSDKGVEVREDDGDFSFYDTFLRPYQNSCRGDFTKLVCCRRPEERCRMDEDIKDWMWTDMVTKKLRNSIHIVHGYQKSQEAPLYIFLLLNKSKDWFHAQVRMGTIDIQEWGHVLDSVSGEELSTDTKTSVIQSAY